MSSLFCISPQFVLASASPRRRALLEHTGLAFTTTTSPVDETLHAPHTPDAAVQTLARRKVRPVAQSHPAALVLAADTVVAHDGDILTKPEDAAHARAMLRRLSGTTHTVHTGLALAHTASEREVTRVETTTVALASLSGSEIRAYVESGSPMDKAGGYGIQDHTAPFFVKEIKGDYFNVVGLPLRCLYSTLHQSFGDLLDSPTAAQP
jgi:septum formation protein